MPADFQAETQRIEGEGSKSTPQRMPEKVYRDLDTRPDTPRSAQGPDWLLWKMINHPERVNTLNQPNKKKKTIKEKLRGMGGLKPKNSPK